MDDLVSEMEKRLKRPRRRNTRAKQRKRDEWKMLRPNLGRDCIIMEETCKFCSWFGTWKVAKKDAKPTESLPASARLTGARDRQSRIHDDKGPLQKTRKKTTQAANHPNQTNTIPIPIRHHPQIIPQIISSIKRHKTHKRTLYYLSRENINSRDAPNPQSASIVSESDSLGPAPSRALSPD